MHEQIYDLIGGIIFTVLGVWYSISYKRIGLWAARSQEKIGRLLGFGPFTENEIRAFQISFLLGGIFFTILGLIMLIKYFGKT